MNDREKVEHALQWLQTAQSDVAFARLGRGRDDILPSQVCFHAQQAVEKSLKSLLIYHDIPFPRTHDIKLLLSYFVHIELPKWAKDLACLSPYAVETRYPGDWDPFDENTVEQALVLAAKTVEWAQRLLTKS